MADTDKLNTMVDDLIHKKPEDAEINFHDYLKTKMQDVVTGEKGTNSDNEKNEE